MLHSQKCHNFLRHPNPNLDEQPQAGTEELVSTMYTLSGQQRQESVAKMCTYK